MHVHTVLHRRIVATNLCWLHGKPRKQEETFLVLLLVVWFVTVLFLFCLAHARLITRQRRQQFVPSSSSCDFVDAMATSPTVRGDLDEPVRGGLNEPAAEEETESFGKRAELDLLYPREAEFVPDVQLKLRRWWEIFWHLCREHRDL